MSAEYLQRVITHLKRARYHRVLLTSMEGTDSKDMARESELYPELFLKLHETLAYYHRTEFHQWDYGWDDYINDPDYPFQHNIITFSGGHRNAYLYDWVRNLSRFSGRIILGGGYEYACLYDLEESLKFLHIGYTRKQELIY